MQIDYHHIHFIPHMKSLNPFKF